MDRLLKTIREAVAKDEEVSKEKLIEHASAVTGCMRRTIRQYIDDLIVMGKITEVVVDNYEEIDKLYEPQTLEEAGKRQELVERQFKMIILKPTPFVEKNQELFL